MDKGWLINTSKFNSRSITFHVNVNDITDNTTIRIKNVFEYIDVGRDQFTLNRYGQDIIPVRTGPENRTASLYY
jgi:hypothetical protein